MVQKDVEKAERLAEALRANLRRRKAQKRGREDLSGRDPKRRDTPLHNPGAVQETPPQDRPNPDDKA